MSGAAASNYDKRLGKVETELARLDATMGGVQRDVADLKAQGSQVLAGIEDLRTRELIRPQPTSWRTAGGTVLALMGGLGMLATFTWRFTAVSPPMLALDKRVTKLDDPEIGRMYRAEKRLDAMDAWRTTVQVQARR